MSIVREAGDVLVGLDDRVPSVLVSGSAAAPPSAITDAVQDQLGAQTWVTAVLGPAAVELELLGDAPAGLGWLPAPRPPEPRAQHWQRPGWRAEMIREVDATLGELGRRRVGPPRQRRHNAVTGLVEFATDGGPVWLKATPPQFSHEAAVCRWVSAVRPGSAPQVLAERRRWWLAGPFPPPGGHAQPDELFVSHAALQQRSREHLPSLAAAGCAMRRPVDDLQTLSSLVGHNTVGLDGAAVERALAVATTVVDEIERCPGFEALVHGDLHAQNAVPADGGWFVYDWTDAAIGHPFADLAFVCAAGHRSTWDVVAGRFADAWIGRCDDGALRVARHRWREIGALHQLATYARMLQTIDGLLAEPETVDDTRLWLEHWLGQLVTASQRTTAPAHA